VAHQALCHKLQHGVAGGVPMGVVDQLEAIEALDLIRAVGKRYRSPAADRLGMALHPARRHQASPSTSR
jgi:hypothetical protein